jgi:hypothetical protein
MFFVLQKVSIWLLKAWQYLDVVLPEAGTRRGLVPAGSRVI